MVPLKPYFNLVKKIDQTKYFVKFSFNLNKIEVIFNDGKCIFVVDLINQIWALKGTSY